MPDDRMECVLNRHVPEMDRSLLERFLVHPESHDFKLLGSKGRVNGTSHADITFKRHILTSAISCRRSLWSCPHVCRRRKAELMFKVASTSFCWSVGAWTVNQRELCALRVAFSRPAKAALKVPRIWGDTVESHQRRMNRALRQTIQECRLPDIDVYVLGRMFDYTGHLMRLVARNPLHLTGLVLKFRDSMWKDAHTVLAGHQGHPGRISPWCWERQYHSYFRAHGLCWQDISVDKAAWNSHKKAWIRQMLGSKASSSNYGVL